MYLYLNNKKMTKVKEKVKNMPLVKKEADRTATEKLVRDIICFIVVIYVSVLWLVYVNSQVKLANAQMDLVEATVSAQAQQEMVTLSMR